MFPVLAIFLALTLTYATALEPLEKFSDGSCSRNQLRPIHANRAVIDSFRYFTAMSKFILHLGATRMPNYDSMREDELYYASCYSRNTTTLVENSLGASFGFGRPLGVDRIITRPGIYFEGTPTDPAQAFNTETTVVTLTDHKSFVFLANCFNGVDQRGWVVLSLTPYLDSKTQRIVEEHALSLGFKRENFAFPRHDSCRFGHGNPALGIGK